MSKEPLFLTALCARFHKDWAEGRGRRIMGVMQTRQQQNEFELWDLGDKVCLARGCFPC